MIDGDFTVAILEEMESWDETTFADEVTAFKWPVPDVSEGAVMRVMLSLANTIEKRDDLPPHEVAMYAATTAWRLGVAVGKALP